MRDQTLANAKQTLRKWFRNQDDAYLTRVVDECRAGTFAYELRCHCLRGLCEGGYEAAQSPDALAAESALFVMAEVSLDDIPEEYHLDFRPYEALRRARVLPMVLAEIKRRRVEIPADVAVEARDAGHAMYRD